MTTQPQIRALSTVVLFVACTVLDIDRCRAQPPVADSALPAPRLHTIFPMGGKAGTSVEVGFGGVDLEVPEKMVFSHPGIKAEPVYPPAPPADPKKPKAVAPPKGPIAKFKVSIAADVPLGLHDCRLVTRWGVTNPRAFVVGDLAETAEKEPNNDVETAQRVALNSTINGTVSSSTDVDYYVFAGKKGQRVVIGCLASTIDSRFLPVLEVYDVHGKLLAANRNYSSADAVTDVVLPADGDCYVRVNEFTYTQGSSEHFYRLTISTGPWIDAVFPSVIEPGKSAELTVHGRNLPGGVPDPTASVDGSVLDKATVTVQAPGDPAALQRLNSGGHFAARACALDGFELRLKNSTGTSNPFLLTYARAPVVVDKGTNHSFETAQAISVPCEIAGRFQKHDRDWYVFSVKKGETYRVEAQSNRLGAATYLAFRWARLADAKKPMDLQESQDDGEFLATKFYAGAEDPAPIQFTADADARYAFMFVDRHGSPRDDPRHNYRVRITQLQPDFHLVVVPFAALRPEAAVVLAGGNAAFTVFAVRQDGFAGDIQLSVEGLPPGVTCPPQSLGGPLKETSLVVSAAAGAAPFAGAIKIKGTATIKGQTAVREARPGGIVWPLPTPGPTPLLGRLERSLWLAVRDKAPYNLTATADMLEQPQGGKGKLKVNLARLWPDFKTPLTVQALAAELPPGLTLNNNAPVTIAPTAASAELPIAIGPNTPPGTYNFVLRSTSQIPYNKDPMAKQKPAVNVVLPSAPLTFTVLPKSLAAVTLANGNPTLKPGAATELVVRVARQLDYAGEYKVQLVAPAAVKDLAASEAVIPAGKNEARLVLRVPAGTAPGSRANLVARVTALYKGKSPIVHEVKFNATVVK